MRIAIIISAPEDYNEVMITVTFEGQVGEFSATRRFLIGTIRDTIPELPEEFKLMIVLDPLDESRVTVGDPEMMRVIIEGIYCIAAHVIYVYIYIYRYQNIIYTYSTSISTLFYYIFMCLFFM